MLADVTGCPAEVVGRKAQAVGLCDACEDLLVRRGVVDVSDWHRWRGAPATVIAWVKAKAQLVNARRLLAGVAFQIRADD